jgi:hypothetical protein
MKHWKGVIKRINKWQYTKRLQGLSEVEDEELFLKELNNEFILLKRSEIEKNEIVFKPGIDPPEGII